MIQQVELAAPRLRLARGRLRREPQRLLLSRTSLGEVSRHLGEPDQLAVLVAKRRDDDVGPEARAVLPHAPAFILEPAQSGRVLELLGRLAGRDVGRRVGRRIEGREVPSDDLVRLVALQ